MCSLICSIFDLFYLSAGQSLKCKADLNQEEISCFFFCCRLQTKSNFFYGCLGIE